MRITMRSLQGCVFVIVVLLLVHTAPPFVLGMASTPSPELSFYRAIPLRELGSRDPSRYDRVLLPPNSESREVFVERTPTATFRNKDLRLVVGHKAETSEELTRMVEEGIRERGKQELQPKVEPEDYALTITFSDDAVVRFREFTTRNDRQMFDLRFGDERLSVGRLYGPFPGNTFTPMGLTRETLLRLERKFPGLIKLQIK